MRARITALLLAVLLLMGLTGCSAYARWKLSTPTLPHTQATPAPSAAPAPTQQPSSGLSRRQKLYGSAGLLTEPTVLVSVYINDAAGGRVWTENAKAETRQYLATAVQWLHEQAEAYGQTLNLYYDDGAANSSLCRSYTPHAAVRGGRDSDESDALLTELDAVSATLDTAALQQTYGTDRIAFLYFLPVSGASFTMVHYADDGDDYYYEYSCLYRYDVYAADGESESPATYAHELLHLFGAPDLYEGSTDAFVDDALLAYIERSCPNDIMHSTYDADGTSRLQDISQVISPLTAYCVGLADTCPELAMFPALADVTPGVFGSGAEPEPDELPGAVAA